MVEVEIVVATEVVLVGKEVLMVVVVVLVMVVVHEVVSKVAEVPRLVLCLPRVTCRLFVLVVVVTRVVPVEFPGKVAKFRGRCLLWMFGPVLVRH
jgi:hypothetical protein